MQGRRRPDGTPPHRLECGEFAKTIFTNDAEQWAVCAPDGGIFLLANERAPDRNGRHHEVEEHEDGAITVAARPHNTNSILSPGGWHGWIHHGVWVPL